MPFSFKPTEESLQSNPQPSSGVPSSFVSSGGGSTSSLSPVARFSGNGIFGIIVYIIFGITVLTTLGLFGYKQYLSSQIDSKKTQLASQESKFGAIPLDAMRKLSNRIKVVNQLIKQHSSVRVAFRIIEDSVENPVTYKNFDLHFSEGDNGYELDMIASAPDYHTVIQQSETFKSNTYSKYVPSIKIEDIRPDDTGNVSFSIKMPIIVTGILPEDIVFAADQTSTSTVNVSVATSTLKVGTSTNNIAPGTSTPVKP